jgi:hypothetical protein
LLTLYDKEDEIACEISLPSFYSSIVHFSVVSEESKTSTNI